MFDTLLASPNTGFLFNSSTLVCLGFITELEQHYDAACEILAQLGPEYRGGVKKDVLLNLLKNDSWLERILDQEILPSALELDEG